MIYLLAQRWALLTVLDAQTSVLANLALMHYAPGDRQGAGYRHWATARDTAMRSLETALEVTL